MGEKVELFYSLHTFRTYNTMRLKNFYFALLAVAITATTTLAGPVYLQFVYDPATTAGNGVPAVDGMNVSSTQSGAGRWHLYAMDTNEGSLGLAQYNIGITGSPTTVLHRSPSTTIQDPDTESNFSAGFTLLRNQQAGATAFIQASQNLPDQTPYIIDGFGRAAGNFVAQKNESNPLHNVIGPTTSGQWGNYATDMAPPAAGAGLSWVLLAEGQYTGQPGSLGIGTASTAVYYNGSFTTPAASLVELIPFGPGGTEPDIGDLDEGMVPRNAVVGLGPLPVLNTPDPAALTWELVSFTGSALPSDSPAAVNPTTGEFSWDTNASTPVGPFSAVIRATNGIGDGDTATLRFETFVPEPASFALFGIAMVGALGLVRRRNG
jgi:hypothetical protein